MLQKLNFYFNIYYCEKNNILLLIKRDGGTGPMKSRQRNLWF